MGGTSRNWSGAPTGTCWVCPLAARQRVGRQFGGCQCRAGEADEAQAGSSPAHPSTRSPCRSALCRGDLVEVKTWFQEDGKLAAQRDFVITDVTTGQPLGRATSTWVMINMQVGGSWSGRPLGRVGGGNAWQRLDDHHAGGSGD